MEFGGGLAEAGFFVEGAGVGLGFHYYLLCGEALAGQAYALGEYAAAEAAAALGGYDPPMETSGKFTPRGRTRRYASMRPSGARSQTCSASRSAPSTS